jgi:hypothetical protein
MKCAAHAYDRLRHCKVLLVVTNISEENTASIITVVVSWKQEYQPTKPQLIVPKRPQYTSHKHCC